MSSPSKKRSRSTTTAPPPQAVKAQRTTALPQSPNTGNQLLPTLQAPPPTIHPALPALGTQQAQAPQQPPQVKFRIDNNGKIRYHARDDDSTRQNSAYKTMSLTDFAIYKNAGKRYQSNKMTDATDMASYVKHTDGKYYHHDKTKTGARGALAANQQELQKREQTGLFIDRSRQDRIGTKLKPFDVGHYKKAPTGSKMDKLSGRSESFGANRDHVVSGESLRRRAEKAGKDADAAYNEGLTVAIPNDYMHKTHSPTFGGRQGSKDTVDGTTKKRVDHDTARPGLAFFRDVRTMMDRTGGQKYDSTFDMNKRSTLLTQHGAYRKVFKASVQMNAKDSTRGVNPADPGYVVTHKERKNGRVGTFDSKKDSNRTIGATISGYFMNKLK